MSRVSKARHMWMSMLHMDETYYIWTSHVTYLNLFLRGPITASEVILLVREDKFRERCSFVALRKRFQHGIAHLVIWMRHVAYEWIMYHFQMGNIMYDVWSRLEIVVSHIMRHSANEWVHITYE